MDSVLIPALEARLPNELHRDYVNKNKEYDNDDNIIGGRQIIKMIIEYFHTANAMTMMYSYENLHGLEWKGDNKVPKFMDEWVEIVDNLVINITPEDKRDLMHKKMLEGETKLFVLDLHHFQRQKDLSVETKVEQPDYTLDYLWRTMKRHIAREKEDRMIEQRRNVKPERNRSRNNPAVPAPETEGRPKKGKGDGKNKRDPSKGKGKGGKDKGKTKSRPSSANGDADSSAAAKALGHCWFHQAKLHKVNAEPCKFDKTKGPVFEDCHKIHGPPLPPAVFKAMQRPGSTSRGPSKGRGKGGKGAGKRSGSNNKFDPTKTTFIGDGDIIIPICCRSFRTTGTCDWERSHPGKTCQMRHFNQGKFEEEEKRLNPGKQL
jgi:hypothetical protein